MYLARTALIGDTFQIELEFRNVVPGKLLYTADSLSRSPQEADAHEPKPWIQVQAFIEHIPI